MGAIGPCGDFTQPGTASFDLLSPTYRSSAGGPVSPHPRPAVLFPPVIVVKAAASIFGGFVVLRGICASRNERLVARGVLKECL